MLNMTKWGNASFDLLDICLETVGIESFRIVVNNDEGINLMRPTVCMIFSLFSQFSFFVKVK